MTALSLNTLLILAAVGLGAFLGGMLRYGLSRLLPSPGGTFAANILGSLALGLTVGFFRLGGWEAGPWGSVAHMGLTGGFAGGLSTWSTFARELGDMLKARHWGWALRYAAITVAIGIIAAWRGVIWAERIWFG